MPEIQWQNPSPKKSEQLSLDPAMPGAEKAAVTLTYPNATTVVIKGDPKIVQQIVARLDNQTIDYVEPTTIDELPVKKDWETCHFVERTKHDINVLHVDCPATFDKTAHCALMDYLKNASDAELKAAMPKLGDYEMQLNNGRYTTKPFPKQPKKKDAKIKP